MSITLPPPETLVRVELSDGTRIYAYVLNAKTSSGRWPLTLLGLGRNVMVDPVDVRAVEALNLLSPDEVGKLAAKQRAHLDTRRFGAPSKFRTPLVQKEK